MENLSLQKFDEKKAELNSLVQRYSNIKIQGIDDKGGYELADVARRELKRARRELQVTGKTMRDKFTQINRDIIAKEKELVSVVEPLEKDLKQQQDEIDHQKLLIIREKTIPMREKMLKNVNPNAIFSKEMIIEMNDKQFEEHLLDEKQIYLNEQERILEEKRRKAEEEKRIKAAEEAAKKKAEEVAKKKLEEEKLKAKKEEERLKKEALENEAKLKAEKEAAIQDEREKADKEKQKLIDKQKAKEVKEKAEKEAKEKAAAAEAEKRKVEEAKEDYIKFLNDNGCNKDTKDMFYIKTIDNERILYKKVATYKFN